MNSLLNRLLTISVISLLLASCGTTPPNSYYLLSANSAGQTPSKQSPSLGIGPIEIPEYLNRNGLVYNREGNRLHIANYERWAEPMGNGVERVMGLNLASLLNTENVQAFPWYRSEEPDYGIQVTVILLDADDDRATLIAEWVIQKPNSGEFLTRRISQLYHDMPAGEVSPSQIAPAYSQLLNQLSEVIAAAISEDIEQASAGTIKH
jgi:uncharacterized lipoprotein YmbA